MFAVRQKVEKVVTEENRKEFTWELEQLLES